MDIAHSFSLSSMNKKLIKKTDKPLLDTSNYSELCRAAAMFTSYFDTFRSNPDYCMILEHVSEAQGQLYIDRINKAQLIDLKENYNLISASDMYGSPQVYNYPHAGIYSPSTLRYVSIASNILELFKFDKPLSIVEIGVGYGGQCRILDSFLDIEKYTLIDISPALMLTKRYLENFNLKATIEFKTMMELSTVKADLIISNYAFSELPRHIQDTYIDRVIQHAEKGYMLYNHISPESYNTYTADEIEKRFKNAYQLPEIPLTHPLNTLIVWGTEPHSALD